MNKPLLAALLLAALPHAGAEPYASAFADYKPYVEPAVADWKATNAAVAAPAASVKADPHAGHKMDQPAPEPDPHAGHNHL